MIVISALLISITALSFPSTIRHGYTSCMTCHYSPTGGGMLRPYGRVIGGELYGAYNDSSNAIPWLTTPDENEQFLLAAFARGVQSHLETEFKKTGNHRLMQLDLESGFRHGRYYGLVTFGARGASAQAPQKSSDLQVRRYYIGASSLNYAVRAGRFYPDFGIRHSNHTIPTRGRLYFNQGQETLALQGHLFFEQFDFSLAALEGHSESSFKGRKGFASSAAYKTKSTRTGLSHMDLSESSIKDSATSLFTVLGYGEGYTLAEAARRKITVTGTSERRVDVLYLESGWEFWKATIPMAGLQINSDSQQSSETRGLFVGLKYYPITHVESRLQLTSNETKTSGEVSKSLFAYWMLNLFF